MNDTTGMTDDARSILKRLGLLTEDGNRRTVHFGAGAQQPANETAQADPTTCAAEFEPVDEEPAQTAQQLSVAATLAEWGGDHEKAEQLRAKAEVAPDEQDNVAEIGTLANLEYRAEQQMLAMSARYILMLGKTSQVLDIHTGKLLGVESFRLQASGPAETGGFPPVVKATQKSRDEFEERRAKKQDFKNTFIPKTELIPAGTAFLQWTRGRMAQEVVIKPVPGGREAEFDPITHNFNRFPYIWEHRPIKPTSQVVMKRTTPHDPRIRQLVDHLLFLAGGDEMAVRHFIYYLAWLYQHPGDKIPWAPLLCTVEKRMGKSCLVSILADVFGGRASKLVSQTTGPQFKRALVRGFTESLDKCWIKFINELPSIRDPEVMDHLKSVITDRGGEAEHKGEGAGDIDRALQIIATTNNVDALPQITSFGRFLVLGTDEKPRPPGYYAQFLAWAGDEGHTGPGAQALADVLWEMEFPPEWNPKAPPPVTDFARQMDSQSLSEGALFVQRLIAQREEPFKKDFQHGVAADDAWMVDEIRSKVANSRYGMAPPDWAVKLDSKKLGRILAELGCGRLSKRASKDKNDNKPRCWRNFEQWNQRSADEMRQHLEDGSRPFKEPETEE